MHSVRSNKTRRVMGFMNYEIASVAGRGPEYASWCCRVYHACCYLHREERDEGMGIKLDRSLDQVHSCVVVIQGLEGNAMSVKKGRQEVIAYSVQEGDSSVRNDIYLDRH